MPDSPQIDVQDIDHLGIIAGIVDDIGIVQIVDQLLGTHHQEQVTPGQIVKALILNCMGFVTAPLYLFSQFFEGKATEHLIGSGVRPEHLNDTRIGRVLDKLYHYGVTKIFVTIALEVVHKFSIKLNSAHLDSTSISVEGQYLPPPTSIVEPDQITDELEEPVPIKITRGYSRDKRPDLKQFMINLFTSEDGGIPLFLELGDGNEVDKSTFVRVIKEFQQQWALTPPDVIVSDCALYSSQNLLALGSTPWITLVPMTITAAKQLLQTVNEQQFEVIKVKGYKAVEMCSFYSDVPQRWIVFENIARKKIDIKRLDQKVAKVGKQKQEVLKNLQFKGFACEADAQTAVKEFQKTLKYHCLCDIEILAKSHYQKVGRPKKGIEAKSYTYHLQGSLEVNKEVIETHQRRAGRFILATNILDMEQYSPKEILETYKKQQNTERGFRFLKDPLFFASSVFLKTPRRIMALAMIMALCLMVYSLGQRQLRQTLERSEEKVLNQKGKPTNKPSMRWILQCFQSVHLVWVNGMKYQIKLNQRQKVIIPHLSCACQKYYFLTSPTC